MKELKIGSKINFTNLDGNIETDYVTDIEKMVLSTYHFVGNRRIAMDPRDGAFFEM